MFFRYRFRGWFATLLFTTLIGCGPKLPPTGGGGGHSSFFDPGTWNAPVSTADSRLIGLGISLFFIGAIAVAVSFYMKSKDLLAGGVSLVALGVAALVIAVLLKPLVWMSLIFGAVVAGYAIFLWFRKHKYKKLALSPRKRL